jgi:hypothetical protein
MVESLLVRVGERFGELTVLSIERVRDNQGIWRYKALSRCDCGSPPKLIKFDTLRSGHTKSCGCGTKRYAKVRGENNVGFKGYKEIRSIFWRRFVRGAVRRNIPFEVTMEYAWNLYEAQGRRCALTGVPIGFSTNRSYIFITASMDRIENSKGYVEGNIQWVHKSINVMKNSHSVEDFTEWCRKVVDHALPTQAAPGHQDDHLSRRELS